MPGEPIVTRDDVECIERAAELYGRSVANRYPNDDGFRLLAIADRVEGLTPQGVEELRAELMHTRQAGQELVTALWALCLAHEPGTASGLEPALDHARETAKRFTSEADRERLTQALLRARAGASGGLVSA
jgi:hypothetical protein